jgi:putative transposase
MREGQKALIDKEIFSIERDISRLEVGDVLIADGHRLDFMVKHPFTGKDVRATIVGYLDWKSWDLIGYEIMVEENTQCVASALRNAIIRLGKKPRIAYQDNGKAFKAKYFMDKTDFEQCGFYGLFGRLEIVPVFAMKYRARAKVIERFWKEFIGKFERLQTSFTGASVDDKPPWTRMGETFHKALHNGYVPTIEEVKDMVDTWIEDYLEVQPCPHVPGKAIGEVFNEGKGPGVDVAELDELLLATELKTIQAGCIRVFGAEYEHENLFGLHESVYIKYSLFDLASIKVYDRNSNYLCTATRKFKIHPMARHMGNAKDVAEYNYQRNKQRALQKGTEKMVKELMAEKKDAALPWADIVDVLPRLPEKLEQLQAGEPAENYETPRIPEGAYGNNSQNQACLNESEHAHKDERPRSFGMDGIDKYEWLEKHPDQITEDDTAWMEEFKNTGAYRNLMELRKEGQEDESVQHNDIKHPVTAGTMHGV